MWTVTDDFDQVVRDDLSTKLGAVEAAQSLLAEGNEFASIYDSGSGLWFRITEDLTRPHGVKLEQLNPSKFEREATIEELELESRPPSYDVGEWIKDVEERKAQQEDREQLWRTYTGVIGSRQDLLTDFDKKLFPPQTHVEFLDREQSIWAKKLLEGDAKSRARYQKYKICASCLSRKNTEVMKFYKIGREDKPHPRDHWLCEKCQVYSDLGEAIWYGHAPADPTEDDYLALLRFGIMPENVEGVMENILGVHGGETKVFTMQALRRMNPEWFKELKWEVPLDYEDMPLEQLIAYSHRDIDSEDVEAMDDDDRALLHLQLASELEHQKKTAFEAWETELFRANPQMTESGFNSRARSTAKQIWKGLVKKNWRHNADSYLVRETTRKVRESKVKQELLEAKEREEQMRAFAEAQVAEEELRSERVEALALDVAEEISEEMAEEAAALQANAPVRRKEWARDWLQHGAKIMSELDEADRLALQDPLGVTWFVSTPTEGIVLEGVGRSQALDMARLLVEEGHKVAFAMTDEPRNIRAQVAVTARGEAFTTSKATPKVWATYDTYNETDELRKDEAIELALQKMAQGATGVFIAHETSNRLFRPIAVDNELGYEIIELHNKPAEVPDTGPTNPWILHMEDGKLVGDLSKENALKAIKHLLTKVGNTYVGLSHADSGQAFLATPDPTSDLGFELSDMPEGVESFKPPENAPIPELVPEPDPDQPSPGYTLRIADQEVSIDTKDKAIQAIGTLIAQGYPEIGVVAPNGAIFVAIEDIDTDLGFTLETEADYNEQNRPGLIQPPVIEPIELDDEVYILMLEGEPIELTGKAMTLEAIRRLIGQDIDDFAIITPDGTIYEDVDDMLLHIQ